MQLHPACAQLSPPDPRDGDHPLSRYLPEALPPRPRKIDNRAHCQPVRDQLGLGACVTHALVSGCMGMLLVLKGLQARILSVAYPYYGARLRDGADPKSEGTWPRSVLDYLVKVGTPLEADLQYSEDLVQRRPVGPEGPLHAAMNKIGAYSRLASLDELLTAIFAHGSAEVTLAVRPGFDGVGLGVALPTGDVRGLHALCAVGYCEDERYLIIRNSWGPDWADHGYCRVSFDYPPEEMWVIVSDEIARDPSDIRGYSWLARFLDFVHVPHPGLT